MISVLGSHLQLGYIAVFLLGLGAGLAIFIVGAMFCRGIVSSPDSSLFSLFGGTKNPGGGGQGTTGKIPPVTPVISDPGSITHSR